jgi:hypothetical protein
MCDQHLTERRVLLIGKSGVGKTSIIHSLLGVDLDPFRGHDYYRESVEWFGRPPWVFGEVQAWCMFGHEGLIETAELAGCHMLVVDGEPFTDELETFDSLSKTTPTVPRIVFVNKWDSVQHCVPTGDLTEICKRTVMKMAPYVQSPMNLLFGSARVYDQQRETWARRELPQLWEELHRTFGV